MTVASHSNGQMDAQSFCLLALCRTTLTYSPARARANVCRTQAASVCAPQAHDCYIKSSPTCARTGGHSAAAPPPRCLRLRLTLRARLPLSPAFPYVTRLIHSPTATSWSPKGAFRSSQTSAPLTIGSVHPRPRRLSNRAQNLDADPSVQRGFQLLLFIPPR